MSGNGLTSEGTPCCCFFPKMNQCIVLAQRICNLQLKAARLFCVIQEDPWGLHVDTGPEASVSHPASFHSLCASSCDPWHGLSPAVGLWHWLLPCLESFPVGVICAETLPHHPLPQTILSAHADPRYVPCAGFPQSTSPCLV